MIARDYPISVRRHPQKESDECRCYHWEVGCTDTLARHVAILICGHHRAMYKICEDLGAPVPRMQQTVIESALQSLSKPECDGDRYQRDGWIFQMISWLAMLSDRKPKDLLRAPQPRKADKGFDGLIVHMQETVKGISICEQKATENPRKTVRDDIWNQIKALERGDRDNQLMNEITAILDARYPDDATELVTAILWDEHRWYRVATTVGEYHCHESQLKLFKGFKAVADGELHRRVGEVLWIDELRSWMDGFSEAIVRELKMMQS